MLAPWLVFATNILQNNKLKSRTTKNQEEEDDETRSNMLLTKGQLRTKMQAQSKLKSNSFASPFRTPGAVGTKTDAQVTYGLRFGYSTYARKDKEISFPTQPVLGQNSLGVDGNRRNKMTFRICSGAVTPVFGPKGLVRFRVSRPLPWPPPSLIFSI